MKKMSSKKLVRYPKSKNDKINIQSVCRNAAIFCLVLFFILLLNFITIWYHLKMELYWFGSQKSRIILSIYSNSGDKIRIRDNRNWFVCFGKAVEFVAIDRIVLEILSFVRSLVGSNINFKMCNIICQATLFMLTLIVNERESKINEFFQFGSCCCSLFLVGSQQQLALIKRVFTWQNLK